MKRAISLGIGVMLGVAALASQAATKPPLKPTGKEPPACAAIAFRPLPSGISDGDQQAGTYKSRHARLELMATVKQGEATDYFVLANGKRLAAAPALPSSAASCAATKKMPEPGKPAVSCTGQRFTVVIDHSDKERLALLYGMQGSSWQFCSAGSF
jgi:hypothetical protein